MKKKHTIDALFKKVSQAVGIPIAMAFMREVKDTVKNDYPNVKVSSDAVKGITVIHSTLDELLTYGFDSVEGANIANMVVLQMRSEMEEGDMFNQSEFKFRLKSALRAIGMTSAWSK